ncbi:DUF2255 family protein [Actinomadura macrotermitis]|uniref:DUF2255 family protein n=1 Tax=Actinomadura macrotermitis TaxID=2585200 RepID=A0A7K0BXK4_9ACTN|nr:DUF2255 family protein [Actinomadura macrotermitis]MQY05918.1 hypothetical protein [Actinomadura macrotermitis]
MTGWNSNDLAAIEAAEELEVAPQRDDGTLRRPTPIWVVRDGDDLYVRSYRGPDGAWFRAARASGRGRISSGGVETDVSFVAAPDPELNDRIDAAYRIKYGHHSSTYVDPMVADPARRTTTKLQPR